jgi:cellulose synthase/poly-beta-1,6-N-acetylglucosamine synthase-like glycosyltransferase
MPFITDSFLVVVLFWLCLVALAYIYVGYPLLVWIVSWVCRARLDREPWTKPISVVVVACNEATRLRQKIESILASDCAGQIIEVLVGSDGSTDGTAHAVLTYEDPRVRLVDFEERRGKPACLNDLVPQCRSEVVVLTDARQELDPTAISRLLMTFADVRTGAVSGELMFRRSPEQTAAARGIGSYWRYEKFIRRSEARFRSTPGATGALYAIRKNVFQPLDATTILDDVVLPMQIIARGYHCAFESGAVAWDEPSSSPRQETIRKRRTIAGCVQLLTHHPEWLVPGKNPIWWEFMSHKIARLFSPVLLLTCTVTNVLLAGVPLYEALLAVQFALYVSAFMGWHYQHVGRRSTLFGPALMFITLNVATVAALWDAFRGRFIPTWQKAG